LLRQSGFQVIDERDNLTQSKSTEGLSSKKFNTNTTFETLRLYQHVFGALHRLEAHETNLHRQNGSDAVKSAVRYVDPMRKTSREDQSQHVNRNQVYKKYVSSPG
jgi:hypothetical protein